MDGGVGGLTIFRFRLYRYRYLLIEIEIEIEILLRKSGCYVFLAREGGREGRRTDEKRATTDGRKISLPPAPIHAVSPPKLNRATHSSTKSRARHVWRRERTTLKKILQQR